MLSRFQRKRGCEMYFGSRVLRVFLLSLVATSLVQAQTYKQLPPPGIEVDEGKLEELRQQIAAAESALEHAVQGSADADAWRSDVDVLIRAVRLAIEYGNFYKPAQVGDAKKLLAEALRRTEAATRGDRGLLLLGYQEKNNDAPQPLVGGFVSRIDDSVQPFGLVVPAGYQLDDADAFRVDVWLHGRGDTKTEIPFLAERMTKVGWYAPQDTFVLHPFGRHCNAFKFAGETDVYESLARTQTLVKVARDRISIRGFSMGGAGVWHLAVHDPSRWFAANPGAGFVDTIVYQGWSGGTPFELTPTARKLLRWYDVLPWTENLSATRTVAYSGEVDKQKHAADRVVADAKRLGIEFPYVIGEGMGHKINEPSKAIIEDQLQTWASEPSPVPRRSIDFTTYTLRYSRCDWLKISGVEEHWEPAHVSASVDIDRQTLDVSTRAVTHLEFDFSESRWPSQRGPVSIEIDGQSYSISDSGNRPGLQCQLVKDSSGEWLQQQGDTEVVRKRPGLQGPIDDAFCDRFVFVLPSRPAQHGRVQRWVARESDYAMKRWRELMRGDAQVVLDRDVTEDHLQTCNLICFGDFNSNRLLHRVASQLPVSWSRDVLKVGDGRFDPASHVPVFCVPNPLNPNRYLVVNSGMTFREFSNNSNSRQIAMLPDWAVLDVREPDDSIYAGGIAAQGFFDEQWKLKTVNK